MIDFRYLVVSLVAVFLALAIGIVLGTTTLNHFLVQNLNARAKSVTKTNERQAATIDQLRKQAKADETFASAIGPRLVAGDLDGQSIVLISAPGADDATRSKTEKLAEAAGATIAADVRLEARYVDPGNGALLSSLAGRLAQRFGGQLPAGAHGTTKAAVALADVLVAPADSSVDSHALATTIGAFRDGKLIKVAGNHPKPGTLGLVLTGTPPSKHRPQTTSALLALARALDQHGSGTVLAGPTLDPGQKGVISAARGRHSVASIVSTVDDVDKPQGRIATVLALARQLRGHSGRYGTTGGATAPLPTPVPSPALPSSGSSAHPSSEPAPSTSP